MPQSPTRRKDWPKTPDPILEDLSAFSPQEKLQKSFSSPWVPKPHPCVTAEISQKTCVFSCQGTGKRSPGTFGADVVVVVVLPEWPQKFGLAKYVLSAQKNSVQHSHALFYYYYKYRPYFSIYQTLLKPRHQTE